MLFLKTALFLLLLVAPCAARADELTSLVRQYKASLKKVTGPINKRSNLVATHVAPILDKIAALSTSNSERWLAAELDNSGTSPQARAAIPGALLAGGTENAARLLISGLGRRPPGVQAASFRMLQFNESSLNVEEAKLLLSQLGVRKSKAAARDQIELCVAVLKNSKNEATRAWLAGDAYDSAGGKIDRLRVLARLAGELKLSAARDQLVELLGHRSRELAISAIEALARIGVDGSIDEISSALDRPGTDIRLRARALDALAGSAGGMEFAIRSAASKDPELRAIAMGSLSLRSGDPRAMKALLAGLNDKDPSVCNVALQSLRSLRIKPMLGALIAVLANHTDESFKVKALELLVNVSGQNFGLAAADWKKWWSASEAAFEFPKQEEEGFTSVKKYDLDYFGIEVSSKRLGLVVDISSSMRQLVAVKTESIEEDEEEEAAGGDGRTRVAPAKKKKKKPGGIVVKDGKAMKIDILKKEMTRLLKKLPADTFLNMISFDATFRPWQKALQPLKGKGRARALSYVARITTGSGTNVFDTLEFALKDKRVDTIYLLTDGLPTRGRLTASEAILKEIKLLNRTRGITIHTIAFGAESNLLRQLAEQNGGQYRFVDRY
ncbi:MAG TPA: hypothetical protein DD471_12150 [Planctomycetes bacterium]|jgi:hypothetical protein|nr:hypothetical protein [Planctomycetota bacterium]